MGFSDRSYLSLTKQAPVARNSTWECKNFTSYCTISDGIAKNGCVISDSCNDLDQNCTIFCQFANLAHCLLLCVGIVPRRKPAAETGSRRTVLNLTITRRGF